MGRLTNETSSLWNYSGPHSVGYQYDAAGRRTKLIYPDGSFVTYAYNANGWLTNISDGVTNTIVSYEYDNAGRRTKRTLQNSTFTVLEYDSASELSNIWHRQISGGSTNTISRYQYGFNDSGNRTWVKRANGKGDVYKYDATDQLTNVLYEATNPDTTPSAWTNEVSYFFDAAGNRTNVTVAGVGTTTYQPNALNQYTYVDGVQVLYDANGNLRTNGSGWRLEYDHENKLRYAVSNAYWKEYVYDAFGRLIGEYPPSGQGRWYCYDGWQLIAEYDNDNNLLVKYVYGPGIDEVVRMTRGGTNYYYHAAALDTVTEITSTNGTVVERYGYDVYGQPTVFDSAFNPQPSTAIGNRLLFQGRDRDPDTGLYNFRYRYYSPSLGRFVQIDPIKEEGGINLYAYVYNSPVNYFDADGLRAGRNVIDNTQIVRLPDGSNWTYSPDWSGAQNAGGNSPPARPILPPGPIRCDDSANGFPTFTAPATVGPTTPPRPPSFEPPIICSTCIINVPRLISIPRS